VRQDLDEQKIQERGHVAFAGTALVQIVLSAINTVSRFMEGVVVYLVNCRMRQNVASFRCKWCVDGQLF